MKRRSCGLLAVLITYTLVLGGCETVQEASTSPDYAKTRRDAAYGAAAGAVVGLLTRGDKLQNALIGAAVGGVAGGAIGNYQDRQERKLREQLAGTGVTVVRRAQSVAAYLESHGVKPQRLIVVGDGSQHPVASNATPEGRQQNRRVELTIVPVEKKA
jgi:outer membrane protein OmpA-like peptidoglycan-associated protein